MDGSTARRSRHSAALTRRIACEVARWHREGFECLGNRIPSSRNPERCRLQTPNMALEADAARDTEGADDSAVLMDGRERRDELPMCAAAVDSEGKCLAQIVAQDRPQSVERCGGLSGD